MADILHRIAAVNVPIEKFYQAITSIEGLSAWWTVQTTGNGGEESGKLEFRFTGGGFDMAVRSLTINEVVEWEVTGGEPEWIGTQIRWQLKQAENATVLLFRHSGWKEQSEFMHHCSTKWATFLMSLKAYLETGKGAPNPHDVKIDEWN